MRNKNTKKISKKENIDACHQKVKKTKNNKKPQIIKIDKHLISLFL